MSVGCDKNYGNVDLFSIAIDLIGVYRHIIKEIAKVFS